MCELNKVVNEALSVLFWLCMFIAIVMLTISLATPANASGSEWVCKHSGAGSKATCVAKK